MPLHSFTVCRIQGTNHSKILLSSCKKNLTLLLKKLLKNVNASSCCSSKTSVYREIQHTVFQEFGVSDTVCVLNLYLISGVTFILWLFLIFSESIFSVLLYVYVAENFVHYQPKCQVRSIDTFYTFGFTIIRSILDVLVNSTNYMIKIQ